VAAALVTVVASAAAWQISESDASGIPLLTKQSPTLAAPQTGTGPAADPTNQPEDADGSSAGSGSAATIRLEVPGASAKPFQAVPISGTYLGGEQRFLRVERLEAGKWVAFPLPTKTNRSGQFTAYVELGQPGVYQLRVLDPDSGATSNTAVLMIKN